MNIFVTDLCPKKSAEYLDDKRVVKMVLETAQILSTALRINGCDDDSIYKATHRDHPVVKWAAATRGNYWWILQHFNYLCREYTRRFGKIHKSQELVVPFFNFVDCIPEGCLHMFVNCAANSSLGISYKHVDDVFTAYKLYLGARWRSDVKAPKWYGEAS